MPKQTIHKNRIDFHTKHMTSASPLSSTVANSGIIWTQDHEILGLFGVLKLLTQGFRQFYKLLCPVISQFDNSGFPSLWRVRKSLGCFADARNIYHRIRAAYSFRHIRGFNASH